MVRRKSFLILTILLATALGAFAQTPQVRSTYIDQTGMTGHMITLNGKTFGPYKDVSQITYSSSGTALGFIVKKRSKTYVVVGDKEYGPLTEGYDIDSFLISDDNTVWLLSTYKESEASENISSEADSDSSDEKPAGQYQVWVNGKLYGTYDDLANLQVSETGSTWMYSFKKSDKWSVMRNGTATGSYNSVDSMWLSTDAKNWGYVVTNTNDVRDVVTQDKTWKDVKDANFDAMYMKDAHWAYGIKVTNQEDEIICVDGVFFKGYFDFTNFKTSSSGKHWGFEAYKITSNGDMPVVVIDGKDYLGKNLEINQNGRDESYSWSVDDGNKVTIMFLPLN